MAITSNLASAQAFAAMLSSNRRFNRGPTLLFDILVSVDATGMAERPIDLYSRMTLTSQTADNQCTDNDEL